MDDPRDPVSAAEDAEVTGYDGRAIYGGLEHFLAQSGIMGGRSYERPAVSIRD
jgi:hypothetical protein